MLSLFVAVQYIGIAILLVEILYIMKQRPSKLQINLLIVVIALLINFVGYLFEIQSSTQEMALLSVKFLYLGKPFIILATFLFVMRFYGIRIPQWIQYALCCLHGGISLLVFTCDRHFLFYSSIAYTNEGYFPHLVLGYSPIYKIYSSVILIYLLILLAMGIHRYRAAQMARERKQVMYLTAIAGVAGAGFLVYFSGLMKGYDVTLLAYLICTVLLMIVMMRYNLLDTVDLAKEHIFDEFADGVLVLDRHHQSIYANPQFQVIYPEFHQENAHEIIEKLEEFSRNKKQFFVNQRVYEVYDKDIARDVAVYGKMLVVRDITDIYDYTIKLENASQAKTDFLAKMSHEIRTPINAVLGMNEMILRESREPEIKQYAADIKAAANALSTLINDILDTSKIESGKLEIIPTEYALDSLLNDVINMVYLKAKEKQLAFLLKIDEGIPNCLFGDDIRIRQVLTNLLNNALKYTEEGSITLEVSATAADDCAALRCCVRDTGIGIREEDLPKLYAAFERIEEERNRNIEGTGLGMNIVVDLLHLMGSSLEVESEYGKGSAFSFVLQQGIVDREPIGDMEIRSRAFYQDDMYEAAFVAPSIKILVVDDNEVNRRVFKGLLKQTLVQVAEAPSGYACLEMIKEERYHIIFMDHMMPELDGIETLHRMRQMTDHKCVGVPVVILTANAVTGAREKYLQEGFDGYLSKPIQGAKLENLLKRMVPEILSENAVQPEDGEGQNYPYPIPELPELDLDYARQYFEQDELLLQTMLEVYHELPEITGTLQREYEIISTQEQEAQQKAINRYQTEVHALKSNTAMIGALILSKLARLLEIAAIERDVGRLQTLHTILIEELEKHQGYMAVLQNRETVDEGEMWI